MYISFNVNFHKQAGVAKSSLLKPVGILLLVYDIQDYEPRATANKI